jgi:hypothetical protein
MGADKPWADKLAVAPTVCVPHIYPATVPCARTFADFLSIFICRLAPFGYGSVTFGTWPALEPSTEPAGVFKVGAALNH